MYNRYVPQPDGSYQRNRLPEKPPLPKRKSQTGPQVSSESRSLSPPQVIRPSQEHRENNQFLSNLLPKDLDTGDLLVIVLLLLMSGDKSEDSGSALLTLALYLLM